MKIKEVSGVEELTYQREDGEQKIYILPNEETVEEVLAKLCEEGISDTIQLSLPCNQAEPTSKAQDPLLADISSQLQGMNANQTTDSVVPGIEELFGNEYLAIDGEQKVYILPEDVPVDKLLGDFKGLRTGEIKQSQMWRKTDIPINKQVEKEIIAAMDKRIQRLEVLLNQKISEDAEKVGKENK